MKLRRRYDENGELLVPEGHVATEPDRRGIQVIALPASLFEITDARKRYRAAWEYLRGEFTDLGIRDLFGDDSFMDSLDVGTEGDPIAASMEIEEEMMGR